MSKTIFDIDGFRQKHKDYMTYADCPKIIIDTYRGILPDILINTWEVFGFQSISNGFLWTVNPKDFVNAIEDLVYNYQVEDIHIIFKTAFGDIVFYYRGQFYHLSAVTLKSFHLGEHFIPIIEMNFGYTNTLNNVYFFNLFKQARKILPELKYEEVYAFSPHIAFGGDLDVNHLHKTLILPYWSFLSDLMKS